MCAAAVGCWRWNRDRDTEIIFASAAYVRMYVYMHGTENVEI